MSAIEGNRQWLDGGSMFGNAPRAVWSRWVDVDDQGRIPLACRCLLIQTDTLNILCETGIGAFFEPKLAIRFGVQDADRSMLIENLAEHGLQPEDIDYVILSHLHFDHAGGLLPTYAEMQKTSWDLQFPKAKYVVGDEAWERARKPHARDRASFLPVLNRKLEESGRLLIVQGTARPQELPSFLRFFKSEGHTPGQLHSIFQGPKKSVVFAGDLIPGKAWVHTPITMGYDRFPEKVIEEKQSLYDTMLDENLHIFFTHDAEIATAVIEKTDQGKYKTAKEVKTLKKVSL